MGGWEREMVKTFRGTFEVFIKGEGSPVCITHNYSIFNETGDHFAEVFAKYHKVYLINLREAGNSAKADEAYQMSMIEAVFDLESIRESLGLLSRIFSGHSTGGMIGVLYGIHFSSSLDKLVIVGAAAREYAKSSDECIYNRRHPNFQKMQDLISLLKENLEPNERKNISKERTVLSLYNPKCYDEYFYLPITKGMSAKRIDFFSREMMTFDVTKQLAKISVKTIIICGKHDVQCPVSFSIEMHDNIANSKFFIFEQSNHYPFLEERKAFDQIIQEYLI